MSQTLLVIDGHSMAFRAFFALPADSFRTDGGQATNAVYGFVSMLVRLMETEKPTHVAVAFDLHGPTFRSVEYPEYKGTRDETPEDFKGQVDIVSEVLTSMGIATLTKENYEADDILATLARQGDEAGLRVLVASGDRDTFQLVNDRVTVLYPGRSASDLKYMTPAAIQERYDVAPSGYPEIAALVGETSDNLPGVPGVGPKTAAQWLNKFGGLDALLTQADKVGGKRGEALREHMDDVLRNRRLNRLIPDLELDASIEDLVPGSPDYQRLEQLFDALAIRGLRDRVYKALGIIPSAEAQAQATSTHAEDAIRLEETRLVDPDTDIIAWVTEHTDGVMSLAYMGKGAPVGADLSGVALFTNGQALVVDPAMLTPAQEIALGQVVSEAQNLVMHGGKAATHAFAARGWNLAQPIFDTELAAYLCRPERRGYSIPDIAAEYLGEEVTTPSEPALFSMEELTADQGDTPTWVRQLAEEAAVIARLQIPLSAQLTDQSMRGLLTDIELPVQSVLGRLETSGIAMDSQVLDSLANELAGLARRAESDAYQAIGRTTNLASPKQLQVILFEELGMPKTRKTKTGWTTDAEALADLFQKTEHPFLEALLRHRDNTKLGQMVEGLRSEIQPDGRIHTTFQQTVAATGRLASSDPNLQNIPARSETGLRVREAFVSAEPFEMLMSVDYSQIEMRIMAHLSGDKALIDAFNSGEDLHRTMAAMVFGVPVEEVTTQLRNRIKATSYGLAYGLSPFGLSRQLGVSVEEARDLHTQYFKGFGGIGRYLHEVVEIATDTGYTETMFGRRRYFPDLKSENRRIREIAERAALNSPIQGSAADIIKVATIAVENDLRAAGLQSRILLQVHDELVLEIAQGEADEVESIVRQAMASPVHMSVPLTVAVGRGRSWKEAAH